ncbi:hypothetical protein [Filimonas effusa]|nr:hypothetical protein [Filimonas effusa]
MAKASKPKNEVKQAPKKKPVKLGMSFGEAIKLAVNTPKKKK